MQRVTYKWLEEKRLPLVVGSMRKAGMLSEDETLLLIDTGGTRYPYQLAIGDVVNGGRLIERTVGMAGSPADIDRELEVLFLFACRQKNS